MVTPKNAISKPALLVDRAVHRVGTGALHYGCVSNSVKTHLAVNFDRHQEAGWHEDLTRQGVIDSVEMQIPHQINERDRERLDGDVNWESGYKNGGRGKGAWGGESWSCKRTGVTIISGYSGSARFTKIVFTVARVLGLDNTFHCLVRVGQLRFVFTQVQSLLLSTIIASRKNAKQLWGDAELGMPAIVRVDLTVNFFGNVHSLLEDWRGRKVKGVRKQAFLDDFGNGASVSLRGGKEEVQCYDKGAEQASRKKTALAAKKRAKRSGQPIKGQRPDTIPTVPLNQFGRLEVGLKGTKLREIVELAGQASTGEPAWRFRLGNERGRPVIVRVKEIYLALHAVLFRRLDQLFPASGRDGAPIRTLSEAKWHCLALHPEIFDEVLRSGGGSSSTLRRARKTLSAIRAALGTVSLTDLCYSPTQQSAMREFIQTTKNRDSKSPEKVEDA